MHFLSVRIIEEFVNYQVIARVPISKRIRFKVHQSSILTGKQIPGDRSLIKKVNKIFTSIKNRINPNTIPLGRNTFYCMIQKREAFSVTISKKA